MAGLPLAGAPGLDTELRFGFPMAQAFQAYAREYDAWYDSEAGKTIFVMEVDCLRPLLMRHDRPYLEIGVGSGRFAQALEIEYGIDPAVALLLMAESKGIQVLKAAGEELPFPDGTFGAVLIALTLCFVDDPALVLRETSRVFVSGGGLILGLILKDSPWGEFYASKGKEGHPMYSRARFFSKDEVENWLQQFEFDLVQHRSVLLQPPGQSSYHHERPVFAYRQSTGFTAISSRKREK